MAQLPNRPWLRFSVRSLLIAVTVVCVSLGWAAHEIAIARERQALRELIDFRGGVMEPMTMKCFAENVEYVEPERISWVRRLAGDRIEDGISVPTIVMTDEEMARIRRAFPEVREIYSL
jgi:hypothetical protein